MLGTDAALLLVHAATQWTDWFGPLPMLAVDKDGSYPEFYQYLKWFWITVLLLCTAWRSRSPSYLAWAALFAYFLADDALRLHEVHGQRLAQWLQIPAPPHLRSRDVGELLISAIAGLTLLPALLVAWWRGTASFRAASLDLLLLVAALVFFGVGIDMLHVVVSGHTVLHHLFAVVEDWGEMVVASLLAGYALMLCLDGAAPTPSLWQRLRHVLRARPR
ncbi:hypothetical protein [Aquabacterium sp.]|uniref:hypothetical protein n=1 Tax=Aquabacterium sp. TaxID=1872578 RepID=UPI002CF6AE36|nr:hypothetical protein [Aquabacterium sp.]HSW05972.1 hypothetical protein [Aquabacterium sp.]